MEEEAASPSELTVAQKIQQFEYKTVADLATALIRNDDLQKKLRDADQQRASLYRLTVSMQVVYVIAIAVLSATVCLLLTTHTWCACTCTTADAPPEAAPAPATWRDVVRALAVTSWRRLVAG